MPVVARILLVEDLPTDAELNEREVRAVLPSSEFVRVDTRDAFLAALRSFSPDLILSDYRMPRFDGLSALKLALEHAPETPFIVVTGATNEDTAVDCLKAGAWDYVIKEHVKRLGPAVESALAQKRVRQERRRAEEALRESNRGLQFLNQISRELNAAAPGGSIEASVARALRSYLGAKIVLVCRHHADRRTLEVQHVEADTKLLQTAAAILRADVLGFPTKLDEAAYARLLSRRVEILLDVHEASFGAIPKAVSTVLHKLFGVGKLVALALVHEERLWGTVMSFLPAGAALPDEKTLSTASEVIAQALERRNSDAALREAKDLVDAVVENVPLMIFLKEAKDLRFVLFNRAGEELLGHDRLELLGKNSLDLFPPEQAASFMAKDREVLAGEALVDIPEEPIQTAKQGLRLLHTRKACIKGPDGVTKYLLGISEDITERRRADEAERQSRVKLKAALASMTDAVFVSDAEGRFIDFNEAFAVFHRFRDKASCARHLSDYPAILEVFTANGEPAPLDMWAVPRALRGEVGTNVEYGLRRKDTGERWIGSYSFAPIRDEAGAIVGSVVVGRDITELRRLQGSLRTTEEQFRVAQELSPDGFTILRPVLDAKGRVVDFTWVYENAAIARMNGTEPKAVVGRRLLELFPDHRGSQFLSAYQHVAASGEHRIFEATFARPDAREPTTLRTVVVPMGGDIAVLAQDISARKQAEAERERLTTAIEQAAETVFITDAKGSITYVNPAFEATSGYTRAELIGNNPRLLKSGVQTEAFYRGFWETISSGRTWHGRFVNQRKDGTRYTEEATVSPVRDAAGNIASYVAVKRDITRDLDLEAQLLQSQKMEGIGRLAGGIAHDFNNILSVILSCTGFALESVPVGAEVRDDLVEIEKAGERAAALTRQLLAFSRKQVLQPELLDLNRVLANMEKMLRRIIGEDVDLRQVLAPDLGLVTADPGQIEQVLMNLAVNARDAMARGGKLTIETANVELASEYAAAHPGVVPGPHVMVAVTDTGTGMDEPTMARIFEPFFTTKGPGKGTGLGLSTVFGIVKQSGGSVRVHSEVGKGTTFKVFLPRELSATTVTDKAVPVAPRPAPGTQTILLVEDEEALRKVARRTLEAAGYTVLVAASGEEALQASARHAGEVHLLLTDVVMPRMGGRVLVEELVRTRPGLRVLYMSGYTDDAIVHHGVLDAGTHFLAKPFTTDALARRVEQVLAGNPGGPDRPAHGAP